MPTRHYRILVVDDHPLIRKGYAYLIADEQDLEICGEAESVDEALEHVRKDPPDLVITDITLSGSSGIDLINALASYMPSLPILVVSMHDEGLYAWRAFRAGARGYVVKDHIEDTVLTAIRKIIDGGVYLSEKMKEAVVMNLQGRSSTLVTDPLEKLTDKEHEIFVMSGYGLTPKEIGECLHVSRKTIDSHRANIKRKLNLSSNAELIRFSVKWNQGKADTR